MIHLKISLFVILSALLLSFLPSEIIYLPFFVSALSSHAVHGFWCGGGHGGLEDGCCDASTFSLLQLTCPKPYKDPKCDWNYWTPPYLGWKRVIPYSFKNCPPLDPTDATCRIHDKVYRLCRERRGEKICTPGVIYILHSYIYSAVSKTLRAVKTNELRFSIPVVNGAAATPSSLDT